MEQQLEEKIKESGNSEEKSTSSENTFTPAYQEYTTKKGAYDAAATDDIKRNMIPEMEQLLTQLESKKGSAKNITNSSAKVEKEKKIIDEEKKRLEASSPASASPAPAAVTASPPASPPANAKVNAAKPKSMKIVCTCDPEETPVSGGKRGRLRHLGKSRKKRKRKSIKRKSRKRKSRKRN
jgi:hypothetical protein